MSVPEPGFPERRLRRLRRTPALRRLVREHRVTVDDLVAPLFVKEGIDAPEPVGSMPGVVQHTQESLRKEVRALADLGLPAVMLFGIPAHKDARGSQADARDGVVQAEFHRAVPVENKWTMTVYQTPAQSGHGLLHCTCLLLTVVSTGGRNTLS